MAESEQLLCEDGSAFHIAVLATFYISDEFYRHSIRYEFKDRYGPGYWQSGSRSAVCQSPHGVDVVSNHYPVVVCGPLENIFVWSVV